MRHWKRLIYYLMINVLVSACTVVAVLSIWQRFFPHASASEPLLSLAQLNRIASPTPPIGSAITGTLESPVLTPYTQDQESTDSAPAQEEEEVSEYEVQSGDTLGAIATRFKVSLEELMAANDLSDPNRLEVGQVLKIPGRLEASPTKPLPEEDKDTPMPPTRTPAPTVTGEVRVTIDSVVGAGDLASERVLLKRTGAGNLDLTGWKLEEEGGETFTFPQLALFEGGAVNLYSRTGQPTAVDLFWGLDHPAWESGETVVLLDSQGNVHATYQIP